MQWPRRDNGGGTSCEHCSLRCGKQDGCECNGHAATTMVGHRQDNLYQGRNSRDHTERRLQGTHDFGSERARSGLPLPPYSAPGSQAVRIPLPHSLIQHS